jgi:hypothetical protein
MLALKTATSGILPPRLKPISWRRLKNIDELILMKKLATLPNCPNTSSGYLAQKSNEKASHVVGSLKELKREPENIEVGADPIDDALGGVKVLSEKTGGDDNFQNGNK